MDNVNAKMFEYVQQYGKIVSFFKIQGPNIIIGCFRVYKDDHWIMKICDKSIRKIWY